MASRYRALAADCDARARKEADPVLKAEWERMALGYRRLAVQADRNAGIDVVYEPPPEQPQVQQQQQQQPQAKPKDEK
jgi:hypothetical protein